MTRITWSNVSVRQIQKLDQNTKWAGRPSEQHRGEQNDSTQDPIVTYSWSAKGRAFFAPTAPKCMSQWHINAIVVRNFGSRQSRHRIYLLRFEVRVHCS